MFCLPQILAGQRRPAAENDDVADLRSAGTLATAPGGHPTQLPAALADTVLDGLDVTAIDFVSDPAQAPAFVQARLAEGAGVDGLAHVWTDLAPDDPASARLAGRVRDQGVFVVTTPAYFEAITAQHVGTADCARPGSSAHAVGALRALRRAGVPLPVARRPGQPSVRGLTRSA